MSARPPSDETELGSAALSWAAAKNRADDFAAGVEQSARRHRRRRFVRWTTATAAVAMVAVAAFLQFRPAPERLPTADSAAIVLNAPKRALPDGSIVEWKDDAKIVEAYDATFRRVRVEQGEAHFEVARDASRPFIVEAGGVEIRALGTAFLVQREGDRIGVFVTEGSVSVAQVSPAAPAPTAHHPIETRNPDVLSAGMRITVDAAPKASVSPAAHPAPSSPRLASATEKEDLLSWRVPRLSFHATPLSEAVRLFNQFNEARLVLDPALTDLQIDGVLRANNVDAFLRLLRNEFGIEAETKEGEVLLKKRLP